MKRKVLHIIDHTKEGGAQVVIRQLIENLGKEVAFSIAVLGQSGRFSQVYKGLGIRVLEIGNGRGRWNPFPVAELIQTIRRDDYDLVHVHLFKSSILGIVAAKYTRRKVILHDHSSVNPDSMKFYFRSFPVRYIYSLLYRLVLTACHRVIVLTPAARKIYHEIYAVDLEKITVVPNGIDPQLVDGWKSLPSGSIRGELGLTSETRVVIMVGRLEPEKDWMTFLKVAQYLPKLTKITFAFLVVGAGSEEQRLHEYATKNNLAGVYFLGYRNDVLNLISGANVFLLTSAVEALGLALLEAMAVGCPVVATRSGGPNSIVTHEFNGLLAEVRDVEVLAQNVVRVLEDDALRFNLVRNARKTVRESYNIQNTVSCVADIYRQVLPQVNTISRFA